MDSIRALAHHLAILMGSQMITSLLSLITILLAPRFLGDVQLGRFAFAQSATLAIGAIAVMGTNIYLTKEIAADRRRLPVLLSGVVAMRIAIWLACTAVLIGGMQARHSPRQTMELLIALSVVGLLTIINMALAAALQGLEAMSRKSFAAVVDAVIVAAVGVLVLVRTHSPVAFAMAMLAGVAVDLVINAHYFGRRRIGLTRPSVSEIKLIAVSVVPFIAIALSQGVYGQLDVIILGFMAPEAAVGWYAAAARWAPTIILVAVVCMSALLPVLSRLRKTDPPSAQRVFGRTIDLMVMAVFPMAAGLMALSPHLYSDLYPSIYHSSVTILAVLAPSWAITALAMLIGVGVITAGRQRQWAIASAALVVFFLALNLGLIPLAGGPPLRNAGVGAAAANVVGESVIGLVGLVLLPRGWLSSRNLFYALRVAVASGVMAAAVLLAGPQALFTDVLWGALVYVAASMLLRTITVAQVRVLYALLRRRPDDFAGLAEAARDASTATSDRAPVIVLKGAR